MKPINIAIADDSEVFRKLIINTLGSKPYSSINIVLEAVNGAELLSKLKETQEVDLILLDIQMPVMNGIIVADEVRREYPTIKIIAMTNFCFEETIITMNRLGVKSFIGKNQLDLISTAIQISHEGHTFFPNTIAEVIQKNLPELTPRKNKSIALSSLELHILRLVSKGMSSKEIGKATMRSHRTIEDYRERLYKKFGVNNKETLIAEAITKKII